MSVSFVSSGEGSQTTSSTSFTQSFNIGTPASNGALVIKLMVSSGTASSLAVTWAGTTMFNIASTTIADTNQSVTFTLFGLINPTAGTNNAAATWVTSAEASMGFFSFAGADQAANSTTFINGTTVNVGGNHTSQSGSVTTVSGNATCFIWQFGQDPTGVSGNTPTPDWISTGLGASVGDYSEGQHTLSTTTSDSYSGAQTVADFLKGCGCSIKASAGGAATNVPYQPYFQQFLASKRKSVGWSPLSDPRRKIWRPERGIIIPKKAA